MSAPHHRFVEDGFARDPVPDHALTSARRVFFIVVGTMCGLPIYVLAAQIVRGMTLPDALGAYAIGGLLAGALGGLSAYVGARTRTNHAMVVEHAFGTVGGRIVKVTIAITLVISVGVILAVVAATAVDAMGNAAWLPWDPRPIAICIGLVVIAVALRGVDGLARIGIYIAPMLLVLLAWTHARGCPAGPPSLPVQPATPIEFGSAVSAVLGAYIVGIIIQPDYGRFVRHPRLAGLASAGALALAYPVILALSALPTANCGAIDLISVMVGVGIGLPAIALLLLGACIDASACLYSGSLGLANELRRFTRLWITLAAGAVGLAIAWSRADQYFMTFLGTLGYTFPPVAVVNLLTYFFSSSSSRLSGAAKPIELPAAAAWVLGSTAGFLAETRGATITGIAALDSVVVASAVWAAGTMVERSIRARTSGAP